MDPQTARPMPAGGTRVVGMVLGLALALGLPPSGSGTAGLIKTIEPGQVLPMEQVAPEHREQVAEVIRENHFHHQGKPETFPCNPKIYLGLLNEPALTLALWDDLSPTPAKLRQVAPGVYQGNDGSGTTATWQFVLRSPRLHVLLCNLDYVGPRGNTKLQGRIVLIVRSGFFKEPAGETWVRHDIEAFVRVDSRGWRTVAASVRPIIEKLLEDQMQEAGWFVSLMARMVEMYPNWASGVVAQQAEIPAQSRDGFRQLIAESRRPGAYTGRPQLAEAPQGDQVRR